MWTAPVRVWDGMLWCGHHPVDLQTTAWEALCVEEVLRPALLFSGCVQVEAIICVHGPVIPRPGFTFPMSRAALGIQRPGDILVHVIAAGDLRRHIQRCRSGLVAADDVVHLAATASHELAPAA